MSKSKDITITDDLKPILSVLKSEDSQAIVELRSELTDTWSKKQIFRTETEMRVSVLQDAKHPTLASKYWQAVREQNSMFENLIRLSFKLRKNTVARLKLEKKLQEAIEQGDDLEQMDIQIDLDRNLYSRANLEQQSKDRVRELKTWSKIKLELDDGSFDTKDPNTHQVDSYTKRFKIAANKINQHTSPAERVNIQGQNQTLKRLKTEDGKLLDYNHPSQSLLENK